MHYPTYDFISWLVLSFCYLLVWNNWKNLLELKKRFSYIIIMALWLLTISENLKPTKSLVSDEPVMALANKKQAGY